MSVPAATIERMVALRRDLHRHPELSWDEHRTMAAIAAELAKLGVPHRAGVARTGILADLPGRSAGPIVALRADTDALPIDEETGLPFASIRPGIMHACGHDGHTAMLVGAAELLLRDPPPVPVRLVFQPAEEHGNGALTMIEHGALDGVAFIFGGHLDRNYPPGVLVVTDGPVNASTDTFRVRIHGRQGHGARPHETVDAVVVGSFLVAALQTVVSREIDPAHPAVVTVGRFEAGSASNVIAGKALLEGTIRAQTPGTRARLKASVERIARSVAATHGAAIEIELLEGTPPVVNPPAPTSLARQAAIEVVGAACVRPLETANMGGEDFAWYLERIPGAYVRFGAQREGLVAPAHSSRFDFDEGALAIGAAWYDRVARVAGATFG